MSFAVGAFAGEGQTASRAGTKNVSEIQQVNNFLTVGSVLNVELGRDCSRALHRVSLRPTEKKRGPSRSSSVMLALWSLDTKSTIDRCNSRYMIDCQSTTYLLESSTEFLLRTNPPTRPVHRDGFLRQKEFLPSYLFLTTPSDLI